MTYRADSDRSALIRLASTMPKGSEVRRAVLAGLKISGSPKLDFPSVSDPDRQAGTEKLYKKLEQFERKHGRSKELTKALEAVLNLNHALTAAEASLYTSDENWRRNRAASSRKTAYNLKSLLEIGESGLNDPETRADVSDWGVNTIRDEWPKVFKRHVDDRTPDFDSKALRAQLLREEFARIQKGNLDLNGYLRARRGGSQFRLDRKMRMAIWAHYASGGRYNSKVARDNRFDHEGKDFAVTIQASGGYGSQYVTLYWPLENIGIMRRKVNTRRVNWGYNKDRISRTAWAHTMLDRLKKASNINAAQRILDQNIKEMRNTEDLNYFHDEASEVKAHDKQLPVPSHRIIEDIKGGDITVDMNGPDLNFYSKADGEKWRDQRMTYYFNVKKRYQKKVNSVRDLLEKARGLDQVQKILTAVKVPWDSQYYADPMWS